MHEPCNSSGGYSAAGSWSLSQNLLRENPESPHSSTDGAIDVGHPMTESRQFRLDLRKSKSSWSLETKLQRGLWTLVWHVLFRTTPKRIGNPWRLWILRMFGARIEGSALVPGSCKILQPWLLRLGDGVAIGAQTEIYNYALVSIGGMSVVSQYSYLCTGTHDYTNPHMPLIWAPIRIGSECWIAADVFIAPGVTIGDGTVVGARSVVTRDLPPWSVCAGNPCKVLKPRVIAP
jgi:putative colanic acid biosynthesis acetyltransferase WcaF